MPKFGMSSAAELATAEARLIHLFEIVVKGYDCTVLQGKRSELEQQANVRKGVSKTMNSKHVYPIEGAARAVDVAPYPLKWPDKDSLNYVKDLARFYHFGGYVKAIAEHLGIPIRWGGDWDGDNIFTDQTFDDLVHFELIYGG